jgi:MFS transporter, DHA1 family, inner membrane transport protein
MFSRPFPQLWSQRIAAFAGGRPAGISTPTRAMTSWPIIVFLAATGTVGAFQIGKAAVGLPGVRTEFHLALSAAAWIVSIFPLLAAFTGTFVGSLAKRFGCRRALVCGLAMMAFGSVVAGIGTSFAMALTGRVLEGAGYLLTVISAPAIMKELTGPGERAMAAAMWTMGLQLGMTIAIAVGPVLMSVWTWHGLWLFGGGLCALAAVAVPVVVPATALSDQPPTQWLTDIGQIARARTPIVFALISFCYMFAFIGAVSLFPTMLIERFDIPLRSAGLMTAAVVFASVLGALIAGCLRRAGMTAWSIAMWSCILAAPAAVGIFEPGASSGIAWLSCILFSLTAGTLHPLAIEGAGTSVPNAALTPLALGLVMQANAAGQLGGPVIVSAAVEYGGWPAAMWPVILVLLMTILLAGLLKWQASPRADHSGVLRLPLEARPLEVTRPH